MQGLDEGTTGMGLTINSKGLQEVYQTDNQLEDKGTAVDTAVLRRSVDMNTYISSQENSRHKHPQLCVEARTISDSRPSREARSLPPGRHGVSMLVKNVEPMYKNVTPRLQQVAGVLLTTTTSSGQGTVTSSIDNRLFGYYNKQWVGYCQQHHDNSLKQENDSDNRNTGSWNTL